MCTQFHDSPARLLHGLKASAIGTTPPGPQSPAPARPSQAGDTCRDLSQDSQRSSPGSGQRPQATGPQVQPSLRPWVWLTYAVAPALQPEKAARGSGAEGGREGPPRSASDCSRLAASRPRAERVTPASPHRARFAVAVAAVAPRQEALVFRLAPRRPGPMAPQRRGPPRAPEGSRAAERRRTNR